MVTVRQSHNKEIQLFDYQTWLNQLALVDETRLDAVKKVTEYCSGVSAHPNILKESREMIEILATLNMDAETLTAASLYPFWLEKLISPTAVEKDFGLDVLKLMLGVDKMDAIRILQNQAGTGIDGDQVDNVRRMLLAMVEDVRAIVIKLAVCILELRRVKDADEETRVLTAKEAASIYAPLANRLGIGQLKWEIEDYAFRFLHPQTYKQIAKMLDEKRVTRQAYIEDVVEQLQQQLDGMQVVGEVIGRPKHIYSIYKKMQQKKLSFDSLFDIRALRILVDTVPACYAALGAVHTKWSAISKEFSDYIATPKANGYQSIHTVVVGPEGKTIEVQIRTQQMHQDAELGVAAHWRYKEGTTGGKDSGQEKINWLRKLLQWQEDVSNSDELVDELRSQVFEERVYVFTPRGQVIDLPQGATPLDFAYYIHSNVGHSCIGAKVFDKIVPFTYTLQSGDQVEILTSKEPNPSRDWLNPSLGYLKTSRAKSKVHHWFKLQDRDKNLEAGRQILDQELDKFDLKFEQVKPAIKRFNMNHLDDLLVAIGGGDLRIGQVINFIQSLEHKQQQQEINPKTFNRAPRGSDNKESAVVVQGVGNLLSYMAKCCQPLPGDAIQGYITQGKGIAVHRIDCDQLYNQLKQNPQRAVDVEWGETQQGGYRIVIRVMAPDRSGLLRDVSTVLVNEKISVHAVNTQTNDKTQQAHLDLDIEVNNLGSLDRVLNRLQQVPGVFSAERLK
ncbi:GTP diphosphokinase [Catenovulum sp. SM1970]|uniref:GTP diphosphokinase n=1 Tax=Marinifaba aquimaris TaxID=2741323 RepID=UPI001572723F|nr:GTP diphosphokinase [Marinifaba aquimaris]NTS78072.1 GTP diphosphokinase [Marinifaba aquimaris]